MARTKVAASDEAPSDQKTLVPSGRQRKPGKLQRLVDLITTLLAHRLPITFDRIACEIPAYTKGTRTSAKRMFERDKQELRTFGIPIETVGEEGSDEAAYRLRSTEFYLPYLTIAISRGRSHVRRVDRYGYHALTTLVFEMDEFEAIAAGARFALQLGDHALSADVLSAHRKLMFDLPLDDSLESAVKTEIILRSPQRVDVDILSTLSTALLLRKRITFQYLSMERGTRSERVCEPYGVFFLNGYWYCAAKDVRKEQVRNFRIDRMSVIHTSKVTVTTPEYEIPATFDLREHARPRLPWQLGNDESVDVVVEFNDVPDALPGAMAAAAALGEPVTNSPRQRIFQVRRPAQFVRWLFSFAGNAIPVHPEPIVDAYRELVEQTYVMYAHAESQSDRSDTGATHG